MEDIEPSESLVVAQWVSLINLPVEIINICENRLDAAFLKITMRILSLVLYPISQ